METKARRPVGRPKGTAAQLIYDSVRNSILNLEMPPGSDLDENALVEKFGVSRTPVREALINLSNDGLVNLRSNRGARVSSLDMNEVPELLEGLELCMRVTTRWAAIRRRDNEIETMRALAAEFAVAAEAHDLTRMSSSNNDFHVAIAVASRNRYLVNMNRSLMPGCLRITHAVLLASPLEGETFEDHAARVNDEHTRMVDAIERRDSETGDQVASDHADLTRSRVSRYVQMTLAKTTHLEDPNALDELIEKTVRRTRRRLAKGRSQEMPLGTQ